MNEKPHTPQFVLDATDRHATATTMEDVFRKLAEMMEEGAALLTSDGVVRYVNCPLVRMLDSSFEAMVGTPILSFVKVGEKDTFESFLKRSEIRPCRTRALFQNSEGVRTPLDVSCSPFEMGDDRGLCLVVKDSAVQTYSDLSGCFPDAIVDHAAGAVVICDTEGRIIRASQTAQYLCGKNPLHQPFEVAFPLRLKNHSSGNDKISLNAALKGESFYGVWAFMDRFCALHSHSNPSSEFLVSATPLRKPGGHIIGCVVTLAIMTERKRMEEALQCSESLYISLVESIPHGVFRKDGNGTYQFANQYYRNELGQEHSTIIGKTDFDLVPLDRAEKHRTDDLYVLETGENLELIEERDASENNKTYVHIIRVPVMDPHGNVVGVQGISLDVTEQVRAKRELQDSLEISMKRQQEFAALLDCSHAVLEFYEFKNAVGAIFHSCKKLVGATAGYVAVLSQNGSEHEIIFCDSDDLDCSEDLSFTMPIEGILAEVYQTGKPALYNDFDDMSRGSLLPEGAASTKTVLLIPLVIQRKVVGLLLFADKVGGFVDDDIRLASAFGEIAAIALHNSRTLESMEDSEDRFRSVLQTANDAIISMDRQGTIVSWNRATEKMFGCPADDLVDLPAAFLIPERFRTARQEGLAHVFSSGNTDLIGKTIELAGLKKDGSEFPVELSLARWTKGGEAFFTAIVRDTTDRLLALQERQALQEQLSQAHKMEAVGQLAGGIAHNINNLLTGIIGNISLAAMSPPEQVPTLLARAQEASDRASALVKQLLAFSRKSLVELGPVQLNAVIEKAYSLLRATMDPRVEMILRTDAHLPEIRADAAQIESVLLNLCLNARDALRGVARPKTPRTITIETKTVQVDELYCETHLDARPGCFVVLSVCDNGPGMDEATRERVFEPFFTTKDFGEGTGLGLSSSLGIVKQHGGWIQLESEPDSGTTFGVYLPILEKEHSRIDSNIDEHVQGGSETVLVVDDESLS